MNKETVQQDRLPKSELGQRGLGWWNLYFIVKLGLLSQQRIDFHLLENFSLVAFLLLPLRSRYANIARHIAAIPIALWLFHYDSFLPPLSRLTAQTNQLLAFEPGYLLELLLRFVPLSAALTLLVLVTAYYLLAKVFRMTVVVITAMLVMGLSMNAEEPLLVASGGTPTANTTAVANADTSNAALNDYLQNFFATESQRKVDFPSQLPPGNQDFDVLLLSVCSLSWDDMTISGIAAHPFFERFDIVFEQFNSATSYSGPALLRLTRASCGQPAHSALYQQARPECWLFNNLASLGYEEALLMNHDGKFDNLLERTRRYGGIEVPLTSQEGLPVTQKAFAGSPVYQDRALLQRWWQQRQSQDQGPVIALYNSATLHDGNRLVDNTAAQGVESYRLRAQQMLDDLNAFFDELENSGRNIVVVLVPEHGGGLRGDKMQISGMREIPSPSITHVPVAVKLIGPGIARQDAVAKVTTATSHMALSQLLANIFQQRVYAGEGRFSAKALAADMPVTAAVSQNEGSTVIQYHGAHFISLDGVGWSRYPTK